MASTSSLYEVLGISEVATRHDIKAAYRRLARTCHPDVVAMTQKEKPVNDFLKVHTAYLTLSDPQKRATHDRDLFRQRGGYRSYDVVSVGMANPSGTSKLRYGKSVIRNWESDQCW